jgi:hypothetical protein
MMTTAAATTTTMTTTENAARDTKLSNSFNPMQSAILSLRLYHRALSLLSGGWDANLKNRFSIHMYLYGKIYDKAMAQTQAGITRKQHLCNAADALETQGKTQDGGGSGDGGNGSNGDESSKNNLP